MSKKFLLAKSASTKIAIGVATIGGVSASVVMMNNNNNNQDINKPNTSPKIETKSTNSKDENKSLQEEKKQEVQLPQKAAKAMDAPKHPKSSNKASADTSDLDKSQRVEESKVPFKTKVVYDNNKPSTFKEITQEGKDGKTTTSFDDFYNNEGKLIQTNKTNESKEEPVEEVITIGTNDKLVENEQEPVISEATELKDKDATLLDEDIRTNQTKEIEEVSNKPIIETETEITVLPIEKDVVYTVDPNLIGDEEYTEVGSDGEKEVTTSIVYVNGIEKDRTITNEEVLTPAKNDVIYISQDSYDKKVEIDDTTEIEIPDEVEEVQHVTHEERTTEPTIIKHEVIRTEDPNLKEGEVVIDQIGIDGSSYDVYSDTLINGEVVSSTLLRTEVTNAISQIERYGVKIDDTSGGGSSGDEFEVKDEVKTGIPGAEVTQKTITEKKTGKIDQQVIYDNTIPEGKEVIEIEGQAEVTETTYRITLVNDEETDREKVSDEILQKGITKVVRVGTAKTTISREVEIQSIDYQIETREDDSLTEGEQKVIQDGNPGSKTTIYEVTFLNGEKVSREEISSSITTQPQNKIVAVGTKKVVTPVETKNEDEPKVETSTNISPETKDEEESKQEISGDTSTETKDEEEPKQEISGNTSPESKLLDLSISTNTSATQGITEGVTLSTGRKVTRLKINYTQSAQEIKAMSEAERYENAQLDSTNIMISVKGDSRLASGIPLSKGTVDYINENLDVELLNKYMLEHVNNLRASVGREPLEYKASLQEGVTVRSDEQAQLGSLRSNGKAHTRPDDSSFRTAFIYLGGKEQNKLGENIAQYSSANQFALMSEKDIAERLFEQWKASPGHYANMINSRYKYFVFDASISRTTQLMNENADLYPSVIGVQIFSV